MIIFKEISSLQEHLSKERQKGNTIGFVPTMGALHEGHLSLISASRSKTNLTVCSIFVNPTQFNDPKDFQKYPVTTAEDTRLLIKENADILFFPSVEEIYPDGLANNKRYDLNYLENILEGAHRPGHFQGVCQVVHRLLDIVQPDTMFLGQKDYQQCMVLKRLIDIISIPTKLEIVQTVRENSGLAMSSRNMRLSTEEKQEATAIYKSLLNIKQNIAHSTVGELQQHATTTLLENGFKKVDYITIANADTLLPPGMDEKANLQTPLIVLAAAFMGDVRLIDNMLLN